MSPDTIQKLFLKFVVMQLLMHACTSQCCAQRLFFNYTRLTNIQCLQVCQTIKCIFWYERNAVAGQVPKIEFTKHLL